MDKELIQYGALGVCVIGMATYIIRIEMRHAKERKEWGEKDDKKFEQVNKITEENNKVLRENTNILAGLKTLLENKNR